MGNGIFGWCVMGPFRKPEPRSARIAPPKYSQRNERKKTMIQKIWVVTQGTFEQPLIAFTDENETNDFVKQMGSGNVHQIQLVEGSVIDELLRGLERKLDDLGVEITGVEFDDEGE